MWQYIVFTYVIYCNAIESTKITEVQTDNQNETIRCGGTCLRCATDGCVKCTNLMYIHNESGRRECVKTCPMGMAERWSSDERFMGRLCYPSAYYNDFVIGSCAGAAVCLIIAACGAAYVRCRPKHQPRRVPSSPAPGEDPAKLRDFHQQLEALRPHSFTLLSILNNTRSQVRELYLLGNKDAAMAYSCVLSDLSKLLILLNKKYVPVVPDEWPRLASWAERVLKRYSHLTGQNNQLVNLSTFQTNNTQINDENSQVFATFNPPSYSSSSVDYNDDVYDKNLEMKISQWSEDHRPPSYSLLERDTAPLAQPWGHKPLVRRETIWLEDENIKVLRPQDELTTEL